MHAFQNGMEDMSRMFPVWLHEDVHHGLYTGGPDGKTPGDQGSGKISHVIIEWLETTAFKHTTIRYRTHGYIYFKIKEERDLFLIAFDIGKQPSWVTQ